MYRITYVHRGLGGLLRIGGLKTSPSTLNSSEARRGGNQAEVYLYIFCMFLFIFLDFVHVKLIDNKWGAPPISLSISYEKNEEIYTKTCKNMQIHIKTHKNA